MSYQAIVLPSAGEQLMAGVMTIKLAKKLEELVNQGMVLIGPPPVKTPGLTNFPQCEDELKQIVDRLWGDSNSTGERKVGKGRVFPQGAPEEIMSSMDVPRDFDCGKPAPFRYIHRRAEDGSEIYFVSNKQNADVEAICNFRVGNRRPEFWWPETGETEIPAIWSEGNNSTTLPVRLSEFGSVFVVFPPESSHQSDRFSQVLRNGNPITKDIGSKIRVSQRKEKFESLISMAGEYTLQTAGKKELKINIATLPEPLKINGPWEVRFVPGWGAPAEVKFKELTSWSDHADQGIRYFSGKATYHKKIHISSGLVKKDRLLFLDLGEVEVMAIVKVNGKELGILWKKPYRIDITNAVHEGGNSLELTVVNLWPNRLIGDANLPEDCTWSDIETGAAKPVMQSLKEYPQWLREGKKSPTGRFAFSIIKVWSKDDALRKSGLLGPVVIKVIAKVIT